MADTEKTVDSNPGAEKPFTTRILEKVKSEVMVKVGAKYKHFKGMEVTVLMIAKDSDTLEDIVVYKELSDGSIWIRPAKNWFDKIVRPGIDSSRFVEIT